jgi:hypothetical protein
MLLALVQAQRPELHAALLAALALTHGERLQGLQPVEWLPIALDIELIERLAQALPAADLDDLVRARQREELGSTLFRSFVSTVGNLIGFTPATLMRQLDKGWRHIFRECGGVEIEKVEASWAMARVIGLPRECLASRPWLAAIPVGMESVFELIGRRGKVRATGTLSGDTVELRFAW